MFRGVNFVGFKTLVACGSSVSRVGFVVPSIEISYLSGCNQSSAGEFHLCKNDKEYIEDRDFYSLHIRNILRAEMGRLPSCDVVLRTGVCTVVCPHLQL